MFLKMFRLIGDVSTLGSNVSASELCATTIVPVWALAELNECVARENASRDSPRAAFWTKLLICLPFQIRGSSPGGSMPCAPDVGRLAMRATALIDVFGPS